MVKTGDRHITAKWNVGQPDADGWYRQARLVVDHSMHTRRYEAELVVGREKVEMRGRVGITSERPNISQTRRRVLLHQQDASRLNRGTLNTLFESALAELRRRFAEGDEAVTAYFDPTSVEHAD